MYGVIDPLIIHETGHEWFGNSVTASDPTHIWIHEGLQVYSEAIYFEDKFDSYPVSVDYLKGIKGRIANKIPIVGNEDENHWALSSDTYMKGAWIMHTLRSAINNDTIWFEILKEFMTENARGHVNTGDFFAKVKEKTGTTENKEAFTEIDGKKYDRELIEIAEQITENKEEIGLEGSKQLFLKIKDYDDYTNIEERTVNYIRKKYKFTSKANKWLRTEIKKWAATRKRNTATSDPTSPEFKTGAKVSIVLSNLKDAYNWDNLNNLTEKPKSVAQW